MDLSLLTFLDLPLSSPSFHLQNQLFWIWWLYPFFNSLLAVLGLHCSTRTFSSFSALQRGAQVSAVAPRCQAQALGVRASVVAAHSLTICGLLALGPMGFSDFGAQAYRLFLGMWTPPGPGIETISPALAGGFLPTVPPGKSCTSLVSVFYHFFILVVFIHRLLRFLCILTFYMNVMLYASFYNYFSLNIVFRFVRVGRRSLFSLVYKILLYKPDFLFFSETIGFHFVIIINECFTEYSVFLYV